jgi:hypothetical protein
VTGDSVVIAMLATVPALCDGTPVHDDRHGPHDLVNVDFVAAAPWKPVGVVGLLGPATKALADTTGTGIGHPRSSDEGQRSIRTLRSCAFPEHGAARSRARRDQLIGPFTTTALP